MRAVNQFTPLPGHRFVVSFDGDQWWHERLLIWPLSQDYWFIYTSDGHLYPESTALWKQVLALPVDGSVPAAIARRDVVRFDGPVGEDEMVDLIESAKVAAAEVLRIRRWIAPITPTS